MFGNRNLSILENLKYENIAMFFVNNLKANLKNVWKSCQKVFSRSEKRLIILPHTISKNPKFTFHEIRLQIRRKQNRRAIPAIITKHFLTNINCFFGGFDYGRHEMRHAFTKPRLNTKLARFEQTFLKPGKLQVRTVSVRSYSLDTHLTPTMVAKFDALH